MVKGNSGGLLAKGTTLPVPSVVYLVAWVHSEQALATIASLAPQDNVRLVLVDAAHVDGANLKLERLPTNVAHGVLLLQDNEAEPAQNLPVISYAQLAAWLAAGAKCVSWL
jgi:hypothetical protein